MNLRALVFGVVVVGACSLHAQNAPSEETTYFIFYRTWDDPAMHMAQQVKAHVMRSSSARWKAVSLSDPAHKPLVDQYQLSRAPTPLMLAVHGNGAVTGAFANKVTESDLANCAVSPAKAACMKCLQQNQLVLLCVQSSPLQGVPAGAKQFQADPHFAKRTQIITLHANDPLEASFINAMSGNSPLTAPYTVLFAPPGVMVGKFPAAAGMNEMATALHAAGKCCNDPNCKHNHK